MCICARPDHIYFLELRGKAINIPQNVYLLIQMFTLGLMLAAAFGKKTGI
jgi:hypothetical protein